MAQTAAQLQTIIENLEAELLRVESKVTFADRSTEFKSPSQISASIKYFKGQLAELRQRPRQIRMVADKGLA